jgi:hypothetical protein
VHEKVFKITNRQGHENQNHSEELRCCTMVQHFPSTQVTVSYCFMQGMVVPPCNPSTWEVEADGLSLKPV